MAGGPLARAEVALRKQAMAYPEAHEDFPWGESAFKVRGKTFLFLRREEGGMSLSVKLPASADMARHLPFAGPTGYGLGRSGWITARFGAKDAPPLDLLQEWLEESYRAVAPKRLSALLP
ncbi:MAG TPA: MmcQ/YjbR family DNA-binding protein [Holophagaceae bacterium]|nr:MmcQ/YjbR family DNA-binding protein [Holophagaceae bacterium]